MFTILLQVVIVFAILHVLWKLLQRFYFKSALDNIPGPPSRSFLFGDFLEFLILESGLIVYSISRCFSTGFQHQGMGISQRYCPEMYEYLSIFYEQDVDASQMVALSRLGPFLGFVPFLFQCFKVVPDRRLIGESTFCLRPKSNAPYSCQSKFFI